MKWHVLKIKYDNDCAKQDLSEFETKTFYPETRYFSLLNILAAT